MIAITSIVFSLIRISLAEKKLTEHVLRLNEENEQFTGIAQEIAHLDEILTTSAYMYIYTKSEHWKEAHEEQRKRLSDLLSNHIRFTSDDSIRASLKYLKIAEIKMVSLENEAIRLVKRNDSLALAVINSDQYWHYKEDYTDGLYQVRDYLSSIKEENKLGITAGLKQNQLMYFLILCLNVFAWTILVLMFNRSRQLAQRRNEELNKVNTALQESLQLERVEAKSGNVDAVVERYLNFLDDYLPFDAIYFIEEKKKELSIRGMVGTPQYDGGKPLEESLLQNQQCKDIVADVIEKQEAIGTLNGSCIAQQDLLRNLKGLEGVFAPLKTDGADHAFLFVDATKSNLQDSDMAILNTILNQFRISLENASIYSGMENKIQRRTKELKRVNEKLEKSERQLTNVFENTQTGVVGSNKQHKYTMVNTQFCNMVGFSSEELLKMSVFDLLMLDDKEQYKASMEKLLKGELKSFTMRLRYKNKEGQKVTALNRTFGVYDEDGKFMESLASILDITDQIEGNKKIMESIVETENLERTRIATTLHDSIGQNLTSLHLMLTALAKSEHMSDEDHGTVDKVINITKRTINETRQISHNLMPKYITRFGLIASVENLVQDLNATSTSTGMSFSLYHNLDDNLLSISEQIAVYRIIQEGVNNILKYSKATNVYVQLVKHANVVTILIDDDGIGFDLQEVDVEHSLGLRSINNRANSISADLEIDSKVGRGTTISIQLTI